MYVRAQPDLVLLELMDRMPFAAADRFAALPLVESEKGWIVAVDDDLSCAERDELAFLLGEPTFFLFSSTATCSKRSKALSRSTTRRKLRNLPGRRRFWRRRA